MKMNKLITTTAIALASAALLSVSVSAAPTASTGDLLLGFQTTSTTNGGNLIDLEINLGAITNFTGLTGGTTVNLTDGSTTAGQTGAFSITDLTSTYGSSAATLKFSVAGTLGAGGNNEVYISQNVATAPATSVDQSGLANSINSMYSEFTNGTAGASGSTDVTVGTGSSGAYKGIAGSTGTYGGNFSSTKTQSTYLPSGSVTFDLYDVPQGGTSTELGYFTLFGNSSSTTPGLLTFTSTAAVVPEPSTYALFGLGALVMVLAVRRRNKLQA